MSDFYKLVEHLRSLEDKEPVAEIAMPVDDDDPEYADDENLPKNKKKGKLSKADQNWMDAQNSMLDHEGKYNPHFNEGRMGFKDLDKLGRENASKVDQECRRRGSADMEPGDADRLRYKVAKEMGLVEEEGRSMQDLLTLMDNEEVVEAFDQVDRITDPEELNLYDEEDIEAANSMSAEELRDELKGDIYHLMDMASDDFTDNDHIADEMGDYFANMHMKGDDASLSCYAAMRDMMDEDPADVYETGKKCLKILGAQEHHVESRGKAGELQQRINELQKQLDSFKQLDEMDPPDPEEIKQQNIVNTNMNALKSSGLDIDVSKPADDPKNAEEIGAKVQIAMGDPALANQVKGVLSKIKD